MSSLKRKRDVFDVVQETHDHIYEKIPRIGRDKTTEIIRRQVKKLQHIWWKLHCCLEYNIKDECTHTEEKVFAQVKVLKHSFNKFLGWESVTILLPWMSATEICQSTDNGVILHAFVQSRRYDDSKEFSVFVGEFDHDGQGFEPRMLFQSRDGVVTRCEEKLWSQVVKDVGLESGELTLTFTLRLLGWFCSQNGYDPIESVVMKYGLLPDSLDEPALFPFLDEWWKRRAAILKPELLSLVSVPVELVGIIIEYLHEVFSHSKTIPS
jgi:hypothetical protein